MYIDANDLDSKVMEADICIIGAGCAGITMAKEFLNTGVKVLLLESGGFEYDDETQSLYEGENVSLHNFDLADTRLRYFGGSTNHWGGMCRPLDEIDLVQRDGVHDVSWPIQFDELVPYYKRAHIVCQLGPYIYDDPYFWEKQPEFSPLLKESDQLRTSLFQFSPPTRFGQVYRDIFKESENIDVILNANVLEVETDEQGKKITSVKAATLRKKYFSVKAKKFVIAMGGMESARLLLLSNKVQKNGLGNANDLVGRYYMDHLDAWAGAIQLIYDMPIKSMYFDLRTHIASFPAAKFGALLTPTLSTLNDNKLSNFRFIISPAKTSKGIDSSRYIAHEMGAGHLPDNLGVHLKNVLSDIESVANVGLKTVFNSQNDFFKVQPFSGKLVSKVTLDLNMEQIPNRNSRVMLSSEKDFFDQNRIKLDWQVTRDDQFAALKAVEILAAECGKYNIGRVFMPDSIKDGEVDFGISSHHIGTTRMADSARTGVVNSDCKVHDIDNLFVSSSSVFPTSGWANPTLTITALALRLADHLKKVL